MAQHLLLVSLLQNVLLNSARANKSVYKISIAQCPYTSTNINLKLLALMTLYL